MNANNNPKIYLIQLSHAAGMLMGESSETKKSLQ
jgi:hypothetical protein